MLPTHRLRLLMRQLLKGVPKEPTSSTEYRARSYPLESYLNEDSADERLHDFFSSITSLGIASQEDWLRLKRICFGFLPKMSCRSVNQIFNHLVKNDVCSQVECVKFQETMAEMNFSTSLRMHEQLQTFHNIAIVGSRISPCFFPQALNVIQKLIEQCQSEQLPLVAYILGRVVMSSDNGNISEDYKEFIWSKLLSRVESLDYFLISQSEVVYLLWSLSTFCLSLKAVRTTFTEVIKSILERGIQMDDLKEASPRDLLLLLSCLCNVLSISEAAKTSIPHEASGVILPVLAAPEECVKLSSASVGRILRTLDVVISLLVRQIAQGKIQNGNKLVVIMEMITVSGATKLLKNAQVLFHLVMRAILFKGYDVWIARDESITDTNETDVRKHLINWFAFSGDADLLELLTLRLALPLPSFVSLNGIEKTSIRVIMAVLEGLVYGNISELYRKTYLESCRTRLPRIIRCCSRDDFQNIAGLVFLLCASDATVIRTLQERAQELCIDLGGRLNLNKNAQTFLKKSNKAKNGTTLLSLSICEKTAEMLSQNGSSGTSVYELVANLDMRTRLDSATTIHCLAILRSMSKGAGVFSLSESQRKHLTAVFLRLETQLSARSLLSSIGYGIGAGVAREELINALQRVESMMIYGDFKGVKTEDAVAYLILAHELGALIEAPHPAILAALMKSEVLEFLSPLMSLRLIGVLLALGVEKRRIYERPFHVLGGLNFISNDIWCRDTLKAFFSMIHAVWTWKPVEILDEFLMLVSKFLPSLTELCIDDKYKEYLLQIATTLGTVICVSNGRPDIIGPHSASQVIEKFIFLVTHLFSDDGLSLSLVNAERILNTSEQKYPLIPECSSIESLLVIAHTMQFLSQMENSVVKKLTSLTVGLWRFCLKYVERMWSNEPQKIHAILSPLAFSIQFGASSQMFDRLMTSLISNGDNVSMSIVCRVANGLLQTGKRRPTATQFVAHYIQNNSLDDLPASALLSLILFITRDAERVALGLTRTDMLIALIWSSLSLKIENLPRKKETLKLFETVPEESRSEFLSFFLDGEVLNSFSLIELYEPISLVLAWHAKTKSNAIITEFLQKAKLSLENRSEHSIVDRSREELLKMIATKV